MTIETKQGGWIIERASTENGKPTMFYLARCMPLRTRHDTWGWSCAADNATVFATRK